MGEATCGPYSDPWIPLIYWIVEYGQAPHQLQTNDGLRQPQIDVSPTTCSQKPEKEVKVDFPLPLRLFVMHRYHHHALHSVIKTQSHFCFNLSIRSCSINWRAHYLGGECLIGLDILVASFWELLSLESIVFQDLWRVHFRKRLSMSSKFCVWVVPFHNCGLHIADPRIATVSLGYSYRSLREQG